MKKQLILRKRTNFESEGTYLNPLELRQTASTFERTTNQSSGLLQGEMAKRSRDSEVKTNSDNGGLETLRFLFFIVRWIERALGFFKLTVLNFKIELKYMLSTWLFKLQLNHGFMLIRFHVHIQPELGRFFELFPTPAAM